MTNSYLFEPGLYRKYKSAPSPRPALFLDRDGVIVEETGYLHRVEDLRLIPGALGAIRQANQAGVPVVVVTNQAGIGRGYYQWDAFEAVQAAIEEELGKLGGWLDGVWACGHHPEHAFRKPNPGMLLDAGRQMGLTLSGSWLAGDKLLDLGAARAAGLAGGVLVRTGYGAEHEKRLEAEFAAAAPFETLAADSLAAAATLLIERCRL